MPGVWLSLPRTWIEALESRRHLSAATPVVNACGGPDPEGDAALIVDDSAGTDQGTDQGGDEGGFETDGEAGDDVQTFGGAAASADVTGDGYFVVGAYYGEVPAGPGTDTLDLADVSPERAVIRVSIDADGNVSIVDGNGDAILDAYAADGGAIFIDGMLAPAHLVLNAGGKYALAAGAATLPDYVSKPPAAFDVPSDVSGTPTFTVDGVPADVPVLHFSVDADGYITAADGNGSIVERVWANYGGSVYLSGDDGIALLPLHVVTDANGAYAFAAGAGQDSWLSFDFALGRPGNMYGDILRGPTTAGANTIPDSTTAGTPPFAFAGFSRLSENSIAGGVFSRRGDDTLPSRIKKDDALNGVELLAAD